MQEYSFEYTRQGVTYGLFLLSFGVLVLSGIILIQILKSSPFIDTILSIGLAVVVFLVNKYRIKNFGTAELSEIAITFNLSGVCKIEFSQLKYYYIYNGTNGTVVTLGFLDGTKFKMGANNNFCDLGPFETLLADLQLAIEKYKIENQTNIIHLESILARKNTIWVLTFITLLVILGFIFTKMPVMIISIGFTLPMIINWIRYFQLKRDNKLVDF